VRSNTKTWAWAWAAFCAVNLSAAAAATNRMEVHWNQLSSLILGREVSLVLPGGTDIAGDVIAVRADSLALDVRKTSNEKVQPKGESAIPRASITTLQLRERKGVGGRVLGVVVGAIVGMVAGGETVAHTTYNEAAAVGTFTGVSVAGAVGGYYVGRSVDSRTTVIRVVAE